MQGWLAMRNTEAVAPFWFRCQSETQVVDQLGKLLKKIPAVPAHMGLEVKVLGRPVLPGAAADKHVSTGIPELLASSSRLDGGVEWLRVSVYLTHPEILYSAQQTRQLWFGLLIAVSVVSACVGLWTNWRAFRRQQRLNEMKSNFVSSVSHELRTPLASIRVLVDSLETRKVSGERKWRQYLQLIGQECRRLSGLIENILDFSRIERGAKQFEFQPTDVVSLVEQVVKMVEPYAAERRVSMVLAITEVQPKVPAVTLFDRGAIEQALLNLIDNAIKHSPEERVVTVGLDWKNTPFVRGAVADPVGWVALWVEDQGPGIPAAEHQVIFERFYRRGSELRRETQGVGIGLSIVKHTVEAHGGRVVVTSAPGTGSRFTMELPLKVQP